MKTLFLVIICFLVCQHGFCQKKELSIKNRVTNKEITIKENRRIKVVTNRGEKFAGRFMVLDKNSISLDGVILDLNEITIIRKHPLLNSILIKANFFHMGTVIFLLSSIVGGLPVILFGIANLSGGIFGGLTVSNISKGYKVKNNWIFKINN